MININIIEIILISLALASDAFSIAICKGLSIRKLNINKSIIIGIWFGIFQSIMFLFGYIFKININYKLNDINIYISFVLLIYIGINMIISCNKEIINDEFNTKEMFILALATSIDSFVYGIVYACNYYYFNIILFLAIGIITFILSFIGAGVGNKIGIKYNKTSQILGGIILILLAFKSLIPHIS